MWIWNPYHIAYYFASCFMQRFFVNLNATLEIIGNGMWYGFHGENKVIMFADMNFILRDDIESTAGFKKNIHNALIY